MKQSESGNPELRLAYRLAEHTGANIFLTGKAGTGKTTFLRDLCARSFKRIVVAAPTGIAAINARGTTLHSLLQLSFGPYVPGSRREAIKFSKKKLALIRSMDMLVIDEVSMVRADLLDYVDDVLRRMRNPALPFGGVQLLLIGDLRQLPPVVKEAEWMLLREHYPSPYFFHSKALQQAGYVTLELTRVYRQDDARFISLLNNLRSATDLAATLDSLNTRHIPDFVPPQGKSWIRLTTHNAAAREINTSEMERLAGRAETFEAVITGEFQENAYPAEPMLTLKTGAQVMFIKNDTEGHRFFNGMIGEVTALDREEVTVTVPGEDDPVRVGFASWDNIRYEVDETSGEMKEVVQGQFSQIPLRAAWAITIHKSQGLTFSHAVIDASAAFAHGQAYVALSRCRDLEGLVLAAPLKAESVITDPAVERFLDNGRLSRPDGTRVSSMELEYVATLLDSLFLTDTLRHAFSAFHRVAEEAFRSAYPKLMMRYTAAASALEELRRVGYTFAATYRRMLAEGDAPLCESPVQERLKAGAGYYINTLRPISALLTDTPASHDSAAMQRRLDAARDPLHTTLHLTLSMLAYVETHPFATGDYLKARACAMARMEQPSRSSSKNEGSRKSVKTKTKAIKEPSASDDVEHPQLFAALAKWRREVAASEGVPAYRVLSTKALISISNRQPRSLEELLDCKGIGPALAERYGRPVLEIIERT